jgi:hypothetical protein
MRSHLVLLVVVSCLVIGCAESSNGNDASGDGGGGTEDPGSGGMGGAGGQGGGTAGAGGDEGETSTAPDAVRVAVLEEPASQLVCNNGMLMWAEQKVRRVRGLVAGEPLTLATMAGDGEIVLRQGEHEVVVGVLGEEGSVHRFTDGEMVMLSERSPVLSVAAGRGDVIWYDGQAIRSADSEISVQASNVEAIAAYDEGPLWISDGRVYKIVRGVQTSFGRAGDDFYPDTFFAFGATAAWGSRSGFKVITMSGQGPYVTGHDVTDVSSGASGITYCDSTQSGVDIHVLHPEAYTNVDKIAATHPTCTSVVECDGAVYWATARGSIFKVPVPSLEQE